MSRLLHVLCVGRACVDEVLELEAYPREDEKVPVGEVLQEGGGQAATAACLVSHLGGRAAFLGVLGDDEPGRFARQRMEAFRVDLSHLPAPRGRTPRAWCLVSRERGSRTILYEASAADRLRWHEVEVALAGARVVLVDRQGEHLLGRLAPFCAARGTPIVADAEHALPGWEKSWGLADVLAVSRSFLAEAVPGAPAEEALNTVAARARGTCVATLGSRGAIAVLHGSMRSFPAPHVAVRDSTGAGDAFHAALALALARDQGLATAIPWAVAVASLCCRGLGGRSFPSRAEADALLPPT